MRFGDRFTELAADWDRWPTSVTWSVDGSALIVTADENGRGPVFTVDPSTGGVTRLTDDDFTYSDVHAAPDGVIFAMRSSYAQPPHPVRIDPDGTVTQLPCVEPPALPGTLTEVTATATTGSRSGRGWLFPRAATRRRRWCCGCTADRWPAGTPGTGGGIRGCSSPRGTRCCCPIRRCPPDTARTSSSAAGAHGVSRRTPI